MPPRHTKMAPAGIQKELQRMFIPAHLMYGDQQNGQPTRGISGVNIYWSFAENAKEEVFLVIHVPLDWVAGTVAWAFPVFSMDTDLFARVRWGLEYTPHVKATSIAAVPTVIEGDIDADGTGTVIPPKSQWLTLRGDLLIGGEPAFQRDDFTSLVHVACKFYRDGLSTHDTHPGAARLLGLAVVYEAFI
jgi:hypothetical protein